MTVLKFKPRRTDRLSQLYISAQEVFKRCADILVLAQVKWPWMRTAEAGNDAGPDYERHERFLVRTKYDAQLAEKGAASVGATLVLNEGAFDSRSSFLLRRVLALDGEILAIEAQLLCVGHLADHAVRKGQERPVGEQEFLTQKLQLKRIAAEELQSEIVQIYLFKEKAS